MPITRCTLPEGGEGYRWGDHGKCYADRADAEKQAEAAHANGYAGDEFIAMDRSARTYDEDGRLRVALTAISKATVNPYYGREIPDYRRFGLAADTVYYLLRDPAELERGASTFCGVQLLDKHIPVNAANPQDDQIVGAIGTDAAFVDPYLRASLIVWDAEAIKRIESGEQRQLSSAYRYDPDMTPGDFEGAHYDGVMRNIRGNHVALVEAGRAGPDVMVGDAALAADPKTCLHRFINRQRKLPWRHLGRRARMPALRL